MRLLLALVICLPLLADEEASNRPVVAASEYGACYAKSVPAEGYGNAGTTRIYRVTEGDDALVHEYGWFSQRIHLVCNASDSKRPTGVAAVSLGPWARGHEASADVLALAFHFDGKTVREYSTLEIAGTRENVSASVSHYTVIEEVLGFRWVRGNEYVFELRTTDGRTLKFDAVTGERLP
jgi:hypothetical protein